ncbi:MAG: ATP-binding protein [Clostridia bacterium]|nr:ATP-binding protein [Clostridia bacterium]
MKLNEALSIKTENRIAAMDEAERRRNELHLRLPRVKVIDDIMREIPMRVLIGESVEALRAESTALEKEREQILASCGYDKDYDVPKFDCPDCNDGGYCGIKLCHCVRELMSVENYRASSLAGGLLDKTFESFSLSYYAQGPERDHMETVLEGCKLYADKFPNDNAAGLYFYGGTGLGKTHLTAAIANVVSAKGLSVIYESAQQIFDTVEAVRFNRADISERKKYENCSLLIIDDLGAECMSQYSVSAITSIIDMRIVNGKKTLISSNLNPNGLKKTYGERLYSRVLGEFRNLSFLGRDIRLQKVKGVKD